MTFPTNYPTSCLLGSVDVTDWMAQEEYRETHPTGESASPYVAVCTNPQVALLLAIVLLDLILISGAGGEISNERRA